MTRHPLIAVGLVGWLVALAGLCACADADPHDPTIISCTHPGEEFLAPVELTSCVGPEQRLQVKGKVPELDAAAPLHVTDLTKRPVPFAMRLASVMRGSKLACNLEVEHQASRTLCTFENHAADGKCVQTEASELPMCEMHLKHIFTAGFERFKNKT